MANKIIDNEIVQTKIKDALNKGEELQKIMNTKEFKALPLALQRLMIEEFNCYCSLHECLKAQESILKV